MCQGNLSLNSAGIRIGSIQFPNEFIAFWPKNLIRISIRAHATGNAVCSLFNCASSAVCSSGTAVRLQFSFSRTVVNCGEPSRVRLI